MTTDINAYMRANRGERLVKKVECADGFEISVQGHWGAYCYPRIDVSDAYLKVECGFPNREVPELAYWKDGDGPDTESVYGYVPVHVVERLIDSHGGIKP